MGSTTLLFGILPLLVFVIVDSFFDLKAALISAVVIALAEAILSFVLFGTLDIVTGFSVLLVLVMSFLSYQQKSDLAFKFQPVVLGVALGGALVISYWIGKPLLYLMTTKYASHMPQEVQNQLTNPLMKKFLIAGTQMCGLALLIHAGIVAYAAMKLSKWWWLVIRGIGFYVFVFGASFLTMVWVR